MSKKIIALLLAFVMMLALVSCGKKRDGKPSEKIILPEKKVAVLVAPEAQSPEDYRAAAELAKEYPDNIIIKEYQDSRISRAGTPDIVDITAELAADKSIGAVIFAKATNNAKDAIVKAKEQNKDLHFVCLEPEPSIDEISALSDAVICLDWEKAANDIVSNAKTQGATHFLMFSINRLVGLNSLYANAKIYFEKACEANGLKFVYENSRDSLATGGIERAQLYVREAIYRHILNKNVPETGFAVFSTDSSVQSTLVEVAGQRGLVYVSPSFPSAYSGVAEVYKSEAAGSVSDTSAMIEPVKAAAAADTSGTAKLSFYNYPLAYQMLKSSVQIAFDILSGKTTQDNFAQRATMRITDASTSENFTAEPYHDKELTNVFMVYCPAFEVIK